MNKYEFNAGSLTKALTYALSGALSFGLTGTPVAAEQGFPEGDRLALWLAMDTVTTAGAYTVPNAWGGQTETGAAILKNSAHIAGSTTPIAQNWFANGVTLTADQVGPDGFTSGIRVLATGVNKELVSSGQSIPAGTYTVVVPIKSNTGSGQTVRIGQSSTLTDHTVTTSWVDYPAVFVLGGVAGGLVIARDDGSGTLDVIIGTPRLYVGDVSADIPAAVPLHGALKGGLNDPPTKAGNIISFSGSQHMMAQWDEGLSLSTGAATHFHLVRRASDPGTIAGILGLRANSVSRHMVGWRGAGRLCHGDSFAQTLHQQGIRIDGQGWQVMTVVVDPDANERRFYIGRQLVQILSGIGSNTSTGDRDWLVGYLSASAACDWLGGGMYGRALAENEINALVTECEAEIVAAGETVGTVLPLLLLEGDSITSDGQGNVNYYGSQMVAELTDRWLIVNTAFPGDGYSQINGRRATRARYLTDTANRTCLLSVWWTNAPMDDVGGGATYLTNLQTIVSNAKTDGWELVISATQTPKTQLGYNLERATVTAGIVAVSGLDGVIDNAADGRYGDDVDASDVGLFADGAHPNVTPTHGYIAEVAATEINAL